MNTYQLQCAINYDCNMRNTVCGVYAADEIPQTLHSFTGLVPNTDPKQRPGKHWIAFFYDNGVLECFDSYGRSPELYSPHLGQFMRSFPTRRVNVKRLQSSDTTVCGQYCLFYLMCRTRGYSMEEITNMFDNNYHLNDEFVYKFINERFYCCMSCSMIQCQICVCENKH